MDESPGDNLRENLKADGFRSSGLWVLLFLLVGTLQIISLLSMPIVYDTVFLNDTLFLLNEAWRIFLGVNPGVDFGSFYPGFVAQFVAIGFHLLGPTVRAIDIAPLMQLLLALMVASVTLYKRCGLFTISAIFALLSTCLLTRAPFEVVVALINPISAHSSYYNRTGLVYSLILTLFVLLPKRTENKHELTSGVAAGFGLIFALMSKWSFLILLPTVCLALLTQRRYAAVTGVIFGFIACWLVLDPTGMRFFGSLNYMNAAAVAESMFGGFSAAILKLINIINWNLWATSAFIIIFFITIRIIPIDDRMRWIASTVLVSGAVLINLVVMGPFTLIGHQILPFLGALSLVCYEICRVWAVERISVVKILAGVLLFAVLFPHMNNSLMITADAYRNKERVMISEGPMSGYLQDQRYRKLKPGDVDFISKAAETIKQTGALDSTTQYAAFVDGTSALMSLGDLDGLTVISGSSLNFEFATGSRPATDFPLWLRVSSPELARISGIPNNAEIVIFLREAEIEFGEILSNRMGGDYRLCLKTDIWKVFLRNDVVNGAC